MYKNYLFYNKINKHFHNCVDSNLFYLVNIQKATRDIVNIIK